MKRQLGKIEGGLDPSHTNARGKLSRVSQTFLQHTTQGGEGAVWSSPDVPGLKEKIRSARACLYRHGRGRRIPIVRRAAGGPGARDAIAATGGPCRPLGAGERGEARRAARFFFLFFQSRPDQLLGRCDLDRAPNSILVSHSDHAAISPRGPPRKSCPARAIRQRVAASPAEAVPPWMLRVEPNDQRDPRA